MAVDGVNKVRQDGRYKLPSELAERYEGEFLAADETEDGRIVLNQIEGESDE